MNLRKALNRGIGELSSGRFEGFSFPNGLLRDAMMRMIRPIPLPAVCNPRQSGAHKSCVSFWEIML